MIRKNSSEMVQNLSPPGLGPRTHGMIHLEPGFLRHFALLSTPCLLPLQLLLPRPLVLELFADTDESQEFRSVEWRGLWVCNRPRNNHFQHELVNKCDSDFLFAAFNANIDARHAG